MIQLEPIEIFRGDTFSQPVTLTLDEDPIDISGWTITLTVRTQRDSLEATSLTDDDTATLTKVVTSHTDATLGESLIELSANQTNNVNPGTYTYDIQIKRDDGTIETIGTGAFIVYADNTRSI